MRRTRRFLLPAVVLLYFFTAVFGGCADYAILRPPRGAIDAGTARRHVVHASDNRGIEIFIARSKAAQTREPEAFVLEFTGNATRAEQIAGFVAHRWDEFPVEAWVMNYPGYGHSAGPKHFSLIAPSALEAYDALKREAGDRPIFLEANSLGTAAALYVAAHRPVAGLVLQNPPPLRRLILGHYGWWNLWLLAGPVALQIPRELDSPVNAKNVRAPAIFLLADHDGVVPPAYHAMVVDAYAGPKKVIKMPNGTHNDSVSGPAEQELGRELRELWSTVFAVNRSFSDRRRE